MAHSVQRNRSNAVNKILLINLGINKADVLKITKTDNNSYIQVTPKPNKLFLGKAFSGNNFSKFHPYF